MNNINILKMFSVDQTNIARCTVEELPTIDIKVIN
jgi:hypothetical protein